MTSTHRTIAIGDIHGHLQALDAILAAIAPGADDTLVILGDLIDCGPDSKGVLDRLIELSKSLHVVTILGNHEEMMVNAAQSRSELRFWLNFGGRETLESYGPAGNRRLVPEGHLSFLRQLPLFYETETHFFIHANYDPIRSLAQQDRSTMLWKHLDEIPPPHVSGKIAIVGHTPQREGRILDLPHLKCIDTDCGHGGILTALDVDSGEIWQVDEFGRKRG